MRDKIPQTINDVDTRYSWVDSLKFAPAAPERSIGGVITPANIARALFKKFSIIL
jgi:hypothetical protein